MHQLPNLTPTTCDVEIMQTPRIRCHSRSDSHANDIRALVLLTLFVNFRNGFGYCVGPSRAHALVSELREHLGMFGLFWEMLRFFEIFRFLLGDGGDV